MLPTVPRRRRPVKRAVRVWPLPPGRLPGMFPRRHFRRPASIEGLTAEEYGALLEAVEHLQRIQATSPLNFDEDTMTVSLDPVSLINALPSGSTPINGGVSPVSTSPVSLTGTGSNGVDYTATGSNQVFDLPNPSGLPTNWTVTISNPPTATTPLTVTPPSGVDIGANGAAGIPSYSVAVNPGQTLVIAYDPSQTANNAAGDFQVVAADPSGLSVAGPGAPTGVTAAPGALQVTVSWTAPGGSPSASSYNLYISTGQNGPWNLVGNTTGTSETATGLANGPTYYFIVQALSAVGAAGTLSATVSGSPSADLVFDNFHDTNGTHLESHTPNTHPVSSSWAQALGGAGAMQIQSNTAQNTVGGGTPVVYTIDSGQADVTITGIFTSGSTISTNDQSDIVFRFQDAMNYWLAQGSMGGSLFRILENKAGVFSTIQSTSFTYATSTQYTIKVVTSGTSITCTLNGANSLSTTSSDFQTDTRHGIFDEFNSPTVASSWMSFEVHHP